MKKWRRRRRRLTGAHLLPFVDDFAMFGETYEATLQLAGYTFSLLDNLGLKVHPTKGHFLPILVGDHLLMILDFEKGEFRAPIDKQARKCRSPREDADLPSSIPQAVGQRQAPRLTCKKSSVPALVHPSGQVFPSRAPRRSQDNEVVVKHRQDVVPAQTRPRVVDKSALPPQRLPNLEARGERLPSLRLHRLRLGSGPQRLR